MDIQEIHPHESQKVDLARSIFIAYFTELYRDIPPKTLGIVNVPAYLEDVFYKTEAAMQHKVIRSFLGYLDQEPAGFSTCDLLEDQTLLLIRTMPIHLKFKEREAEIRQAFIAYFKKLFPSAKSVILMVRKANSVHTALCLEAGFTKDDSLFEKSTYLKTTYDAKTYAAYHCLKKN